MTKWRDPAFVAEVQTLRQQGLSQAAVARALGVAQQVVWQAIHQRRSGHVWGDDRPRCQDCGEPVSDIRYPRCRTCAGRVLSAQMLERGGNVKRCAQCWTAMPSEQQRGTLCKVCRSIARRVEERKRAAKRGRPTMPEDIPPEQIEAIYAARLAEVRRTFRVDPWAQRGPGGFER